jgi:transmembrane sensor
MYGGMAAGIAAAVGTMGFFPRQREAVLITARGELRKVPLQDKSIATINSGSRIEVQFTEKQRMVKLREGEAWFEVAKDKSKPFIVEAGDARVRAVGTAFAVRRFENGAEVLVTEGTVEVWTTDASAQRRRLGAGERAFLGPRADAIAVLRQPGEINRKLAWREGKLILKNQTLSEAVADFNRYSPKTIVILDAALGSKRLFGQYQLDAPELFARDVSTILGVPLVITADRIYIGQPKADSRGI